MSMTYVEARIHELNANVAACIAEMHGMLALNEESKSHGHALAYSEDAFLELSKRLEEIGHAIRSLADKGDLR